MILDVMLPGLSGYRVVRRLRAEEHWLPVLMLSAKDGEYDQADGLDCGADDYLTKPFSYVVLLARLRALLRRGRAGAARRARASATCGWTRPAAGDPGAGAEVALTAAGVRAAGVPDAPRPARWSPRPSCSTTSGTPREDTAPNAVEVYVGYLRRKIGRERAGDGPRAPATGWPSAGEPLRGRLAGLSLRARLHAASAWSGWPSALGARAGWCCSRVLGLALQRTVDTEAPRTAATRSRCWPTAGALPDPLPVAGAQVGAGGRRAGPGAAASIDADRLVPLLRPDELAARPGSGRCSPCGGPGSGSPGRCGWSPCRRAPATGP